METRTRFFIGALAFLVAGLLLLQTPLLQTARDATWRTLTSIVAATFSIGDLSIDNDVSEQLQNLTHENIRLKAELKDYQILREQLRSPAKDYLREISALVSARPLNPWRTEVMLNKGASDGVSLAAPVVINGSTLVGFISDLAEHTATLQLLPHPALSMPADIVAETPIRALLKGVTHTGVTLATIPRDAEIYLGQPVVTVGDDQIPAGLLLGNIDKITAPENDAYQSAQLALPYNTDTIKGVIILVKP